MIINENSMRAERAKIGLIEYFSEYRADYTERDNIATAVSDMLCDMRHLCDREGLDFAVQDRIARQNYLAELQL